MNGTRNESSDRREFLKKTGLLLTTAAVTCPTLRLAQAEEKKEEEPVEKVFPPEDLMREHGVLRRILLIYEDIQGRLNTGKAFPAATLSGSAEIIRKFIEEYHEKLEEDYLFPKFQKAGKLVELTKVLKEQHKAGRKLTAEIKAASTPDIPKDPGKRKELAANMGFFIRMYRPHSAREDTILFPALRSIVSPKEFDSLGEEFEDKEVALFGEGGFEKIVGEVAELEKSLGIYELAQFTPPK
jgi:hemerythrin-like domain-containing protein